jgi:hypothetical protein
MRSFRRAAFDRHAARLNQFLNARAANGGNLLGQE